MTSTTVAVFALLLKHTSCKGYNTFAQLFHMTMTLTSYNETDDNHDDDDDDLWPMMMPAMMMMLIVMLTLLWDKLVSC